MYESFSFWESLGLHIYKKDEIVEWLDTYALDKMEDESLKDFENEICLYIFALQRKETKKHTHSLFTKTYNERKDKALKYVAKLALTLIEGMSTKKGKVLAEMLLDMHRHPQDYIYNVGNTTASIENIDSYIETYRISTDARKELLNILKK